MPADVGVGPFEFVDQTDSGTFCVFAKVVIDGLLDVLIRPLPRDDRLRLHARVRGLFALVGGLGLALALSRNDWK